MDVVETYSNVLSRYLHGQCEENRTGFANSLAEYLTDTNQRSCTTLTCSVCTASLSGCLYPQREVRLVT
jgi:hypothetical protein